MVLKVLSQNIISHEIYTIHIKNYTTKVVIITTVEACPKVRVITRISKIPKKIHFKILNC